MNLAFELEEQLTQVPILDPHTHLIGGRLGARGLHDVLLYHMAISELYAAGCPSGARLTQFPGEPSQEEARARLEEAIPFLPYVRNTGISWGIRIILTDLYDWHEPVTESNWRELDDRIRERAADRAWHHAILDRAKIARSGTELARRGDGSDDERLQYALEWGMFMRCQWGEFDTALYELERTWGRPAESPTPIGSTRPPVERTIRTLDDVHDALRHYVESIPYDQIFATAMHLSTDINYRLIDKDTMAKALVRRENAGEEERDIYASYIAEAFFCALEKRGDKIVFHFSLGAEPLPYETGSRLSQNTIAQLAEIIGRHPNLRFQCLLSSRHANQGLCTLARELPNFSLAGFWWHNFYPDAIRHLLAERLDLLPLNKHVGFFSDAYCVEWSYAKAVLMRKQLARVLGERVHQGQFSQNEAIGIAQEILFETPRTLLGMKPHSESAAQE
jgi:glucuronate isomerase